MPEASTAQGTLKRLIEAEDQARMILETAEKDAETGIAQARGQARQSVESVREQAASLLQSQLAKAAANATIEMKRRLDQAESDTRDFERQAEINFSAAVDFVVNWVISGGGSV